MVKLPYVCKSYQSLDTEDQQRGPHNILLYAIFPLIKKYMNKNQQCICRPRILTYFLQSCYFLILMKMKKRVWGVDRKDDQVKCWAMCGEYWRCYPNPGIGRHNTRLDRKEQITINISEKTPINIGKNGYGGVQIKIIFFSVCWSTNYYHETENSK